MVKDEYFTGGSRLSSQMIVTGVASSTDHKLLPARSQRHPWSNGRLEPAFFSISKSFSQKPEHHLLSRRARLPVPLDRQTLSTEQKAYLRSIHLSFGGIRDDGHVGNKFSGVPSPFSVARVMPTPKLRTLVWSYRTYTFYVLNLTWRAASKL